MPFTELALPKLKTGAEVKAAFAAKWPLSAKTLASQSTIPRAFFGSVISENGITSTQEENKPIIVIGRRCLPTLNKPKLTLALEWINEEAFKSFLASEDFKAFAGPMKPLSAGPAELQLFDTDKGPLEVASAPVMEIFRVQLTEDPQSAMAARESWKALVNAIGPALPVTSGTSLNLKDKVLMGTVGWNSLEVCRSD
jgi:hypothetical protein